MSEWNDSYLRQLFLSENPLIDVRAPIEFFEGSIPHSTNLPLMNDEERRLVGLCYKMHGQEAAIKLGHELINGQVKRERIEQWIEAINLKPQTQVFCFRGGLRSQIACEWIREAGIDRHPIPGGYKRMRRFFLSQLEDAPLPPLYRLGGLTGSGKTSLLQKIPSSLDLEQLAHHRGSAFGSMGWQPSQVRFENELALKLMGRNLASTVVEDEGSWIGKINLPRRFYQHLRNSPLLILKTDDATRVKNIFEFYVRDQNVEHLSISIKKISRNLGGLRFKEVQDLMMMAFEKEKTIENHAEWIMRLLHYYYDPFYMKDLNRQQGLIKFTGSEDALIEFLQPLEIKTR
jgi:tRNA 2-selenouridine synthase